MTWQAAPQRPVQLSLLSNQPPMGEYPAKEFQPTCTPRVARPADDSPTAFHSATDSARLEHPARRLRDEDLKHLLTPAGTGPTVVEGRMLTAGEAGAEVRESDVRAAFAGLPRIKPHWTHW